MQTNQVTNAFNFQIKARINIGKSKRDNHFRKIYFCHD